MLLATMAPKKTPPKKQKPKAPDYVLPVHFNPEEMARLEAVGAKRGLRRSTLLKSLLKDEANRLGIP
jgi:hypothetical protein